MKKSILILLISLFPVVVIAAGPDQERPHWSLEVKGGLFEPDIPNWKEFYGKSTTSELAGAFAYKITRRVELGIEGGYAWASGQGLAPLHSQIAGSPVFAGHVDYKLYPLSAFILARGVFNEKQVVVPYIGGGWTRMYYEEKTDFQGTIKGHADGYHGRAGLQFLLDGIDESATNSFYEDYGVFHTYFFMEAEYSRVMAETVNDGNVNLGGTSWLAGLLFEF